MHLVLPQVGSGFSVFQIKVSFIYCPGTNSIIIMTLTCKRRAELSPVVWSYKEKLLSWPHALVRPAGAQITHSVMRSNSRLNTVKDLPLVPNWFIAPSHLFLSLLPSCHPSLTLHSSQFGGYKNKIDFLSSVPSSSWFSVLCYCFLCSCSLHCDA